MNSLRKLFGDNVDLVFVALVLAVLAMLFAPVPAPLLDYLIVLNFGFALLVLLITFYAPRPVDFSTFPAILLIATMFRLALNVSATRLILTEGDAGHVIGAVGSYVVSGNFVIGFVVFLILIVVQFVVVTAGAQRVSEVAARFTLDSMPGQQMSIDADLNMGFIDQEEAQRRRKNLEKEASFYGAMDGASKFVKGDAIAGIIIMLINVLGGLVIGVMQMGMTWGDSLRHFTLLTIGDGIVTQVPALIVSMGTGLIVTRSSSDSMLSAAIFRQMTSYPRTLLITTVAMLGIGMMPGMPVLPALLVAAIGLGSWLMTRHRTTSDAPHEPINGKDGERDPISDELNKTIDPVEVAVGSDIAAILGNGPHAEIMERLATFREAFAEEMGIALPPVKFRDKKSLPPSRYEIALFGDVFATGSLFADRWLAIPPNGQTSMLEGIETRDPSYGLPAIWIEASQIESARAAKCTIVDAATVLVTHLMEVMRHQAAQLLTRLEVERQLARVRLSQPGLVEELVPTQLTVGDVQKVLQLLLKERVPVRNIQRAVVEALLDGARINKDPSMLVETVRQRLGMAICNSLGGDKRTLHVMTLHPDVESRLLQDTGHAATSDKKAMADPRFAEMLLHRLALHTERMIKNNLVPMLLCPAELRRHIKSTFRKSDPSTKGNFRRGSPHTIRTEIFCFRRVAGRSKHIKTRIQTGAQIRGHGVMSDLMLTALSALKADQSKLDFISANAANASTPGYRRKVFASLLDAQGQTASSAQDPNATSKASGSSLPIARMVTPTAGADLTHGAMTSTGRPLDLAIDGEGYFLLASQGQKWLTRAGSFKVDAEGFLVGAGGHRLQAIGGDIQIDRHASLAFGPKGEVRVNDTVVAQLAIMMPAEGTTLSSTDGVLLVPPLDHQIVAREGHYFIKSGFLEGSNSGGIRDSLGTLEVVRHYESTIRLMQGYDDMLGKSHSTLRRILIMLDSLYISALGMQAQKTKLDMVSNNLANANTPGYKKEKADFGAVLDQRATQAAPTADNGLPPVGMSLVTSRRDLSQGEFQATDSAMDLAINGAGFMEVTLEGGRLGYIRGGSLRINADGFLTNSDGILLKSDIRIPTGAADLRIDKQGMMTARLGNDDRFTELGRIELVSFANPDSLQYLGGGVFETTATSVESQRDGTPSENGLGELVSGRREMANVKLVDEMVTLMMAQRVYELNSKVIQAADEIMGLTNNLRRG